MGSAESIPIPGGGTEGYHVLRVLFFLPNILRIRAHLFRFRKILPGKLLGLSHFLILLLRLETLVWFVPMPINQFQI
jgi:hypothetical protein